MSEEKCIFCETVKAYSEKYDAYYCPKCLYWSENMCPDRGCVFCKDRPQYPEGKPPIKWDIHSAHKKLEGL